MIISVDLDNVIRDQIGSIITASQRRYGVTLSRSHFCRWDPPLGQIVGLSDEEFTAWAWADPMIFAQARPVAGAIQALWRLSQEHRIVITTATACPDLTEPWLTWWRVPYSAVIHTRDKGSVAFDWHIDDSPTTLQTLQQQGRPVIRFALPWNAHLTDLPGLAGWEKIISPDRRLS